MNKKGDEEKLLNWLNLCISETRFLQAITVYFMFICSIWIVDSLWPHGLYSPWNSPGQNTRVGSLSLLQANRPNPGIEPRSPTLQVASLPAEPQGMPRNTGVGSLSLLCGIFLIQESNRGLLHCKQILYHLSHQESPGILEWVAYPFSRGSSQPRDQTGVSSIVGGWILYQLSYQGNPSLFSKFCCRGLVPSSLVHCRYSSHKLYVDHESEWTPGVGDGQGGLACCDSWGRKESDTTEWLNWTELSL